MADQVENLTTEMLRRVHTKLDDIQAELRLRFTGVETGLAAIDHHLAAFHAVDAVRADEIADLRRRLERVERRLELGGAV
jgi:tetrahydromethanopterin S-methyltransferase subunit G